MVEIRTLTPIIKIRSTNKPATQTKGYRPRANIVVVRRTQESHPTPTPQPTPCRLWQGAGGSDGYGWRKLEGKPISMHRWVMSEVLGRRLRPSEVVLHACDNPFCYRIDHLSIGTVQSNNDDMRAKGRATKPPVNVFHGEAHPMAKLTAAQVRAIKGHLQSGLSVKTIAAMFEISATTVRRIRKGESWAMFDNHGYVKPPTRDLLAEARERLRLSDVEAASAAEPAEPPKRIRPVKHLTLREGPDATHP